MSVSHVNETHDGTVKRSLQNELRIHSWHDLITRFDLHVLDLDVLEAHYQISDEQIEAVLRFWAADGTCLLWGLTGSGKSLVALLCASRALSRGGKAGVLTTTVVLSQQIFETAFGSAEKPGIYRLPADRVMKFSGGGSVAKRRERYHQADYSLLIGTREAAANDAEAGFFPLLEFDCLICDEFHNICRREGYARLVQLEKNSSSPGGSPSVVKLLLSATPAPSRSSLRKLCERVGAVDVITLSGRQSEKTDEIVPLHMPLPVRDWINAFLYRSLRWHDDLRVVFWRAGTSRDKKRPKPSTIPPTVEEVREYGKRIDRYITKGKMPDSEWKLMLYHFAHLSFYVECAQRLIDYHPIVFLDYFARAHARAMIAPSLEPISKTALELQRTLSLTSMFREAAAESLYSAVLDYEHWLPMIAATCPDVDVDAHSIEELQELFFDRCWRSCLQDYPYSNPKDEAALNDLYEAACTGDSATFIFVDSVLQAKYLEARARHAFRHRSFQVAAVIGEQKDNTKVELVERFRKGEIGALISTTLGEGVDAGKAKKVVNYIQASSAKKRLQREGRLRHGGRVKTYLVADSHDPAKWGRINKTRTSTVELFRSYAKGEEGEVRNFNLPPDGAAV